MGDNIIRVDDLDQGIDDFINNNGISALVIKDIFADQVRSMGKYLNADKIRSINVSINDALIHSDVDKISNRLRALTESTNKKLSNFAGISKGVMDIFTEVAKQYSDANNIDDYKINMNPKLLPNMLYDGNMTDYTSILRADVVFPAMKFSWMHEMIDSGSMIITKGNQPDNFFRGDFYINVSGGNKKSSMGLDITMK